MALQIPYTTRFGLTAPEAYARISSYSGDKDNLVLNVAIHATATARLENLPPLNDQSYSFPVPTVEGDLLQTSYELLKTLPDFANATDV